VAGLQYAAFSHASQAIKRAPPVSAESFSTFSAPSLLVPGQQADYQSWRFLRMIRLASGLSLHARTRHNQYGWHHWRWYKVSAPSSFITIRPTVAGSGSPNSQFLLQLVIGQRSNAGPAFLRGSVVALENWLNWRESVVAPGSLIRHRKPKLQGVALVGRPRDNGHALTRNRCAPRFNHVHRTPRSLFPNIHFQRKVEPQTRSDPIIGTLP